MKKTQRELELEKALQIAAELFSNAGYETDSGCSTPEGIKRWLLRQAKKELLRQAEEAERIKARNMAEAIKLHPRAGV